MALAVGRGHRAPAAPLRPVSQGVVIVEGVEKWQEQNRRSAPAGSGSARGPVGSGVVAGPGDELTSVRFAHLARQLGQTAQDHDLRPPTFRSPPRVAGVRRSIRRQPDGSATVAVAIRGRPAAAVVADMIDGIVAANELRSSATAGLRDRLWSAAAPLLGPISGPTKPSAPVSRRAA